MIFHAHKNLVRLDRIPCDMGRVRKNERRAKITHAPNRRKFVRLFFQVLYNGALRYQYPLTTPSYEPADFVNHCCEPSCGIRGQILLVAMKDLEPGEQITSAEEHLLETPNLI